MYEELFTSRSYGGGVQYYKGTKQFSEEDNVWHGKLLEVDDLVTYEATLEEDLFAAFNEAVDDFRTTRKSLYAKDTNSASADED